MLIRTIFRDPLTTSHASLQSDSHSSNFSIIILRMDKTKGNFIIIFMHAIESKKKKKNYNNKKKKNKNKREQKRTIMKNESSMYQEHILQIFNLLDR